jgi:flagellar basal-body rod protein FlgC
MSLFNVFGIAGSSLAAQSLRLNITASNLANAEAASSSIDRTYRARQPVFAAMMDPMRGNGRGGSVGVRMVGVVESSAPVQIQYEPDHPMADDEGYVYLPNVNPMEEMANMIAASRSYQNSVEVINTSKQLLIRTLSLGQ